MAGDCREPAAPQAPAVAMAAPAAPLLPRRPAPPEEFGGEGPTGRYRRGEEIGFGGFGRVFRCWRRPAGGAAPAGAAAALGEAFAAKVIDLRRLRLGPNADRDMLNLKREADILKSLPAHPNVVSFVDSVEEPDWFFFVLELVAGGDLQSILRALGRRRLETSEAAFVLRQLVDALAFLHGRGVVHRDLKPENVLVASVLRRAAMRFFRVKLSDFGLSKVVGEGLSECRSMVGTRRYVAPEVLVVGGTYDCRVDLWSLGVLSYVLLEGAFPSDRPAHASQVALDAAVSRLSVPRRVKAVVSGLLRLEPCRRLGLGELASHAWLRDATDAAADALEGSVAEDPLALRRLVSGNAAAGAPTAAPTAAAPALPLALASHSGPVNFCAQSSFCSGDLSAMLAAPVAPGAPTRSFAHLDVSSPLLPAAAPPGPVVIDVVDSSVLDLFDLEDLGRGAELGVTPSKRRRAAVPASPEGA